MVRHVIARRGWPATGRAARSALALLLAVGGVLLATPGHAQGTATVVVARVDGAITPVIADYVDNAVRHAERSGATALVIELDTPGGLDTSMRDIVQDILDSEVPVVVYVAPSGARAASAGAIITFAAHVAAMAPGTAIGAATPVGGGGEDLEEKATNDAAAYAVSLARLRGRNVEFAEDAVREARSIDAGEALESHVVDVLAPSLDQLLQEIDGTVVRVGDTDRAVTLATEDAAVDEYGMGLFRRIRQVLADPNVAFFLLSLGLLGLIYELASPGLGAGAIIAALSFVLAFAGLAVLPLNAAGFVFLGLAAALFVAEVLAPGIGIAAAGGAAMLLLAGIFLVDDAPGIDISLTAVAPVAIAMAVLAVVAGRMAFRARAAPSTVTGTTAFVGRTVEVRGTEQQPLAFVEGAWWRLRGAPGATGSLAVGERAEVVDLEDLTLVVRSVADRSPAPDKDPLGSTEGEEKTSW
jgi:membrane-bound serine protease (ClpP class)